MAIDLFNQRALRDLRGEVSAISQRADSLQVSLSQQQVRYQSTIARLQARARLERSRHRSQIAATQQWGVTALKIMAGEESSSTHSWTRTPMAIDDLIKRYLRPVRARSRQVSRSDEIMCRFLNMVNRGVVGPDGVTMQAQIVNQNGELDDKACEAVENAWAAWGDDPANCDVEGRLAWVDLQMLHIRTVARDGEFLARKIRGKDAGPYGFSLQVLDPELLDVDYDRDLDGGNKVRFGIEYNTWWRPVAYWLRTSTTGWSGHIIGEYDLGQNSKTRGPSRAVRVPAEDIIHSYLTIEPCQRRGWPWAFSALLTLNMLGGYEEAALFAARVGASKFFVLEAPADDVNYRGDERKTSDAEGDTEGPEYVDAAEPGVGWRTNPGEKLSSFDPSYPNGEFDPFTRAALRRVASGLDVSYMSLSGDLSQTSYASGRTGLQDERDVWMTLQNWQIRHFCRPVYRDWLPLALLNGKIQIGGNVLPWTAEREQKFSRVIWQGRRWQWIDPEAEVAADTIAIEQGTMTRTESVRNRTGRDFLEVCKERQREDQILAKYGITVPVVGTIPGGQKKGPGNA